MTYPQKVEKFFCPFHVSQFSVRFSICWPCYFNRRQSKLVRQLISILYGRNMQKKLSHFSESFSFWFPLLDLNQRPFRSKALSFYSPSFVILCAFSCSSARLLRPLGAAHCEPVNNLILAAVTPQKLKTPPSF